MPSANAGAVGAFQRSLSGLHTLVVDDDRYARDVLRLLLAYFGAAVSVATTARAALTAIERARPDVVVADILLTGGEDGLWLRREARARWPRLPFIAVSGEDYEADVIEAAGFATYLRKPVSHEELVNAVLAAITAPPP